MYSLERDPGLADLAFYTAKSIHELRGLKFDESSRGESLVAHVEFKVIKIALPLGGKRHWSISCTSLYDIANLVL